MSTPAEDGRTQAGRDVAQFIRESRAYMTASAFALAIVLAVTSWSAVQIGACS